MATPRDEAPVHDVHRGLALVAQGLDLLAASSRIALGDEETREALATITVLSARTRAAYLALLAESARRDRPDPARPREGAETCSWLAARATMAPGRVHADLREALALDPGTGQLPRLGAALADGSITAEHAGVGVRALAGLPESVLRRRHRDVDTLLTDHAQRFSPPTTRKLARHLLDTVDPDRADRFDTQAHLRRELHMATDSTGMGVLRGQLHPAAHAHLKAVLDHLAAPHRGPVEATHDGAAGAEGAGDVQVALVVNDTRTPAQRRHDALVEMTRLAAGALQIGVRAGEPPRVVVHTTADQLTPGASPAAGATSVLSASPEPADPAARPGSAPMADPDPHEGAKHPGPATCEQTGPLTPGTLALLACDGVLERVLLDGNGRVRQMSTHGRLFSPAQRRALGARDGGCAFPGCDRPPSWCDAHHIVFWSHGGPTTLDNGVLLCGPHHTEIHAGHWQVVSRDGVPWFVPPPHLDPRRRAVRNTVHTAVARTRHVGRQLAFGLPIDPEDPGG